MLGQAVALAATIPAGTTIVVTTVDSLSSHERPGRTFEAKLAGDLKAGGKAVVPVAGREWHGEQPRNLKYWERLSEAINRNPVRERDRMIMAMLKPLGIEKGKPFKPDARQQKILEDAVRVGEAMAKPMTSRSGWRVPTTSMV
jgi:hypothetical protein